MTAKKEIKKKEENNICFTIMPFGGWFDKYYEEIYIPAIQTSGLEPKRADDLYRPSTIIRDIWQYTKECKLIVADLTGKNPNVLYELGLGHAIAKPVIIITENLEDIPFDLKALRIIEYDKNAYNWGELLKNKIAKSIQEVLSSPLKAVLPTFLDVDTTKKTITQSDKNILELSQDVDKLRREVRMLRMRGRPNRNRINPELVREKIKDILEINPNISTTEIITKLERYEAPHSWIKKTRQEIQEEINKALLF